MGPVLGHHARTDRTRGTRVAEPRLPAPEDGRPVGMQVRIRTNSLEFEFAPNSHEFVDHSELEFATSNSNPP